MEGNPSGTTRQEHTKQQERVISHRSMRARVVVMADAKSQASKPNQQLGSQRETWAEAFIEIQASPKQVSCGGYTAMEHMPMSPHFD